METTNGSIDLKEFEVYEEGVLVFSGYKTGIDTIKPDDYTVVGTPTISADGVASGFSDSNYLTTANEYIFNVGSKPWEAIVKFKNNGTSTGQSQAIVCSEANKRAFLLQRSSPLNAVAIYLSSDGTTNDIADNKTIANGLNYNDDVILKIKFTGTQYLGYCSVNGGEFIQTRSIDSTTPVYSGGHFIFGRSSQNNRVFNGSIDLNAFKIYVNGDLLYQPCLKIPYTQSKTGSKVVNSTYRGRVNDMAEQFGYANYYTLDEDNGNFTLPQVELPGLIGNKTLRDSYYNGVTYWELYSNRRLEQGGSCESGVEYTLPKPFADANYILTIPYSSKTATSFIPSATGDFIAKGTGLL
jgi:hypothetical protein